MSGSDEEMYEDHEIDPQAHEKLLSGVNSLRRTQHIKPPTRTEASTIIDEFHMTKSVVTDEPLFTINDLIDGLKKSKKHLSLAKKLQKIHQPNKVLQVPLEKPVADRIQRSIGYDNVKKKLSRWDAVVAQSRSAEQQVFPLDCETIHINTGALKKPSQRSFKSDLMIEMEKLDAQLEEVRKLRNPKDNSSNKIDDDDDEIDIQEKLTRDELIARRKEIQYLRMKESEKSSKLRLKNKIKSKKYHKLLKREKLREQLKEFEILRKTNPELALEKLEKIEKNRVQERASLRHKNTGTWAKNLQVRAKYDKDVRKDLAEQLALSRELTHKKKSDDEDDDDNESDEDNGIEDKIHDEDYDPFNPWVTVKGKKTQKNEIAEFLSGYRKYWMERNKSEKDLKKFNEDPEDDSENTKEEKSSNVDDKIEDKQPQDDDDDKHEIEDTKQDDSMSEDSESDQKLNSKIEDFTMKIKKRKKSHQISDKKLKNKTNKMSKKNINKIVENGWVIEEIDKNVTEKLKLKSIDAIFDEAEDILEERVQQKINKLTKDLDSDQENRKSSKKSHDKDELKQLKDLSFKKPTNRPEFDEELLETSAKEKDTSSLELPIRNENNDVNLNETSSLQNEQIEHIDPNKYSKIKPKSLRSSLPDMINSDALNDSLNIENDDDDDNDNENFKKQLTIMEAFEDDDIVVDFQKERDNDCKKTDAEDIDLSLPGWGTWAGCGISKDKQIKKRIIFKLPKEVERRDKNKTNVYINEDISKDLKDHLVSDLPFPFTRVRDFEASIRQPLGRTFIPETAFRMLTRPSVITKQGKIIDPLDESALLKPEPKPKHIIDKRISKLKEKMNKKKLMKKKLSKISK